MVRPLRKLFSLSDKQHAPHHPIRNEHRFRNDPANDLVDYDLATDPTRSILPTEEPATSLFSVHFKWTLAYTLECTEVGHCRLAITNTFYLIDASSLALLGCLL